MIQFFRGLKAKYTYPSDKFQDGLYFATDTNEIILNGVSYGIDIEKVKDVEYDSSNNILTFTKQTGDPVEINFGDKLLTEGDRALLEQVQDIIKTGNISVMYDSQLDSSIATTSNFGGIAAGTTVGELTTKTISQVLDDLLFPTVTPVTNDSSKQPKASLSLKSSYKSVQLVGSTAPTKNDFNSSFSKGEILLAGKKQNDLTGEVTSAVIYFTHESDANGGFPEKVTEGTMTYTYKVTYEAGPQPKDSKGNNSGTPYPAGSKTATATVKGVYQYYAGTGSLEALSLTNDTKLTFTVGAEGGTNKQQFALPAKYTLTKVEILNTLNNEWVEYNISTGLTTTTTTFQDAAGTDVSYKVYTRSDVDTLNGSLQYRITFTK